MCATTVIAGVLDLQACRRCAHNELVAKSQSSSAVCCSLIREVLSDEHAKEGSNNIESCA
jgi:hypothetical protein